MATVGLVQVHWGVDAIQLDIANSDVIYSA